MEVFPGKDGVIRSVNVKTVKVVICKSVQRLHDLEITNSLSEHSEENITCCECCNNSESLPVNITEELVNISQAIDPPTVSYSRSGQVVNPVKLDL